MEEIVVIESVSDQGTEWGISFSGYNPPKEKYVRCLDKETAFRLKSLVDSWKR